MKTNTKTKAFLRIKKYPPARRYLSLFLMIGIFLLPNLARLSAITPGNIIKLTNKERAKEGLPELAENKLLAQAAYQKGLALIENKEFAHNLAGRRFSDWIKDAGYKYEYVGENLALDFYTGEGVVAAWLDSPSHKKNLLNQSFKEIGVAVLEGDLGAGRATIVVQVFGAPAKVATEGLAAPLPVQEARAAESLPAASFVPAAPAGASYAAYLAKPLRVLRHGTLSLAFSYKELYLDGQAYFWVLNFWLLWLAVLLYAGPDTLAKLRKQRYIIG